MTLELPDMVRDRIENLRTMSGAASVAEVIRRALATFDVLLTASIAGGRIEIHAADGSVKELVVR